MQRTCRVFSSAVRLNSESIGEGGRPLIILHGLFGHIQNWKSVGRALAQRLRRRVVLADLRNHGASPHSPVMSYEAMASDTLLLVEREGEGRPVDLLGHSMGGKTAMAAALQRPQFFHNLIIADVAPRVYSDNSSNFRTIIRGIRDSDLSKTRAEISAQLVDFITEKPIRDFILTNLTVIEGRQVWKMNYKVIENSLDDILDLKLEPDTEFPRPALFLRGANSNYVRDSDLSAILKIFPRAVIESIPDAGHWVHAEKPQEFITSVSRFLKEN